MASLTGLTANPTSTAPGGTSTLTPVFSTNPGTPSRVAHVVVLLDGGQQGSADVQLQGTPAETTPTVTVGTANVGWEIRTSAGTLTPIGNGSFSLLNN